MDLIELGNTFFQNPANAWIAYLLAAFFAVDAIVLRWLGRRMVQRATSGGAAVNDNAGVIVTGDVKGGVHQQQSPSFPQSDLDRARKTRQVLNVAANFSTVIAAVIAAMAYFNS